jgi:hypothetical protein
MAYFNLRRSPLRDLRERHEISVEAAADALDVHANAISWLEAHTCVVEPATWETISAALMPDYAPTRFLPNIVGYSLEEDVSHDNFWQPSDDGGEA